MKNNLSRTPPFLVSLHRPFHQQLKASKWVCLFLNKSKSKIRSSELNVLFYLYLLQELYKEYGIKELEDYNGLPSKTAVFEVYDYLKGKKKEEKISIIKGTIKKDRSSSTEKQIYSTYKAASYYVNMAKDKLKLIDQKNCLTQDGTSLTAIKSSFLIYSDKEKEFYFKRLVEVDFLLFISLCLFKRLSIEFKFKDYNLLFEFLDKYYDIHHFNFTSSSLNNYNTVRSYWIESLNILDGRNFIKKKYINYLQSNEVYRGWFEELNEKFNQFRNTNFKEQRNYLLNKERLEKEYSKFHNKGQSDLGFVNLYDIKPKLKMSSENFQSFLEKYYEDEKGKRHIFFSNIVNSIDRRKRFKVRGIPVLKIKIK